jgi:predicted DsbA family dithiol-disulfide isomerase
MKKLVIFAFILTLAACGSQKSGDSKGSTEQPVVNVSLTGGDPNAPVAELNGAPITAGELDKKIGSQMTRIKTQIYEMQSQGINSIINERLLDDAAKKAGLSTQALLQKEVTDKVGDVSDKEVEEFFSRNQRRFPGKTLDEVKDPVKKQIIAQKSSVYRNNYMDRLKDEANIKIFISRPSIDVSVDDDPMKGTKGAPITIIEFTDYQCPFCGRARPTVQQIIETYGDKVHYVLRDFPLSFHKDAKKASEAAQCAGDQDKYWEYSDKLWSNQRALTTPDLKKYAQELSLNQKEFDQCLDSGKFSDEVDKDMADGSKAGVTGTPSFFINGQMLTGARPFEQFKEIIDMELLQKKNKG